jgi:hypothetical protein
VLLFLSCLPLAQPLPWLKLCLRTTKLGRLSLLRRLPSSAASGGRLLPLRLLRRLLRLLLSLVLEKQPQLVQLLMLLL